MSDSSRPPVAIERTFHRFTYSQRWEHLILLAAFTVLLLTGLPQKYRASEWSQWLLSTPERVILFRQIHHIAALVLTAEVIYHLGKAIYLAARRRLSGAIFPTMQDGRDFVQMMAFLFFLSRKKPAFGKYNFEQKFTYWFLFFGIGIMVISGFILWFPEVITIVLPGGVIPAALLAHSNEAVIAVIFIIIWHFYHVHFERLNLSIFTGRLSEREMRAYHAAEFENLTGEPADWSVPEQAPTQTGGQPGGVS